MRESRTPGFVRPLNVHDPVRRPHLVVAQSRLKEINGALNSSSSSCHAERCRLRASTSRLRTTQLPELRRHGVVPANGCSRGRVCAALVAVPSTASLPVILKPLKLLIGERREPCRATATSSSLAGSVHRWPDRTLSSDLAMCSQLPCLGV
jgi:hypothetical protein